MLMKLNSLLLSEVGEVKKCITSVHFSSVMIVTLPKCVRNALAVDVTEAAERGCSARGLAYYSVNSSYHL